MVEFIVGREPPENVEEVLEKVNISCMKSEIRLAAECLKNISDRGENSVNIAPRNYGFHHEIRLAREEAMGSTGRFHRSKQLLKKVIAKATGWYLKDLFEQQSEFNADTVSALGVLAALVSEMKKAEEKKCEKQ